MGTKYAISITNGVVFDPGAGKLGLSDSNRDRAHNRTGIRTCGGAVIGTN